TPQVPASAPEFETFCTTINHGVEMTISELSKVRRLHFEASTMIVAHTRQQVSGDGVTDGVKKMPQAEKQARLVQQQAKLQGLSITGELQPSHALIDLAASMLDNNAVIWIAPSKCSKREAELQLTAKEKPQILSIEQQLLKVTAPKLQVKVDNATEIQMQWSLQRRGIALDQCGLVEWSVHQHWVQYLMGLLVKPSPDGYNRIRMDQLLNADRELFTVMSEELQHKNVRLSDTPSPMNVSMTALVTDPRITMHLLPLPFRASTGAASLKTSLEGGSTSRPAPTKKAKKAKPSARAKSCPAELKDYKQRDDAEFPLGLPGLSGVDKLRTETANLVYDACAQLVQELVREVLRENLSLSPADLALKRCKELAKWTMRAAALKEEELVFKQGMQETVLGQLRREDDQDELVVGTWAKTLEEVSLGYIWQDHDSKPDDVFLAKRSLGVEICLDGFKDGVVTIGHTNERCEELGKVLGFLVTSRAGKAERSDFQTQT
ncbi:unnamed protein product, partial [Effrenium voratum]